MCALLCVLLALLAAGCDRAGTAPLGAGDGHARFQVVAAENFWGSIAGQLAGDRAHVQSIIVNPNTDPHSYQPTAQDAREMAGANVAIVNGVGYDEWAQQLLQASASSARAVLNVGTLLGLSAGANPHRWYYPQDVRRVAAAIVADYDRVDPGDRSYFAAREQWFLGRALAPYDRLLAQIRERYAGVPVGYSESIFEGLGEALGLKLLTPYSFAKSIAEGTDVSVADKRTVDAQARERKIAVWVFNSQNVTPDVQRVTQIAQEQGIPIVTITETLAPASASFQQWQVGEMQALERALGKVHG
jgi:zinc/manganese transport system substrate-binding protein